MPATALAACGGGDSIPGNAVAKIGDSEIKKETFDRWMRIAAISSQGPRHRRHAAAREDPAAS
jgi:hypothetical protein